MDTEETTGGTAWEDRSCADSQGTTRGLGEAWTDPPLVPAEGTQPCPHLNLGHLPPELCEKEALLFKPPSLWSLLQQPQDTNTQSNSLNQFKRTHTCTPRTSSKTRKVASDFQLQSTNID